MNPISYLVDHMMLPFLNFSYEHIFPNYGVAILLLTALLKLAFYPLTQKQFLSIKAMQALQPELKKIQQKFKGQPEKLQKEMMALYRENKVNPLSGCLPLLVQMPFLFALFYTMNSDTFKELIMQPGVNPGLFSFWLANLGQPDKTYILPVIIGVSTYLSQKLTTTDPQQAKILMFMPVFMFVICLKLPSGVLLYWAASQVLSTAQQMMIMKKA